MIKYVSLHPGKQFMLSCASDGLGGWTVEALKSCDDYIPLKELLKMENVIVSVAS